MRYNSGLCFYNSLFATATMLVPYIFGAAFFSLCMTCGGIFFVPIAHHIYPFSAFLFTDFIIILAIFWIWLLCTTFLACNSWLVYAGTSFVTLHVRRFARHQSHVTILCEALFLEFVVYFCYLSGSCSCFRSVKAFSLRLLYNSNLSLTVSFLVAILFLFCQSVGYCATHAFLPNDGRYPCTTLTATLLWRVFIILLRISLLPSLNEISFVKWSAILLLPYQSIFILCYFFYGVVHALTAALLSYYQRVCFYYGSNRLYLQGPALAFTLLFRGLSHCAISISAAVFSEYFLSYCLCPYYYSFRDLS